jgi:Tfp pilus assembly protein PilZ
MDSNPEQRNQARFKHVSSVTYEDLERGIYAASKMYDYSKGGLYFESDLELQVGERIFIGIENSPYADETGVYECYHALIKWRKMTEHSIYRYGYGIQYCDPTQEQDKQEDEVPSCDLLKEKTVAKDQRKHPRISVKKEVNCFSSKRPFKGVIKNIGPSGAFIATDQQFDVGQKFAVVLPFVKKGKGALVKAEVIWKNDRGIGVKFKKAKKKTKTAV